MTNILNRYGDLNNLNMALPSDGRSTFVWPMRFQWKYIDITLLNGSLPNIISNHARYNNDIMDNILNPGSVYITILRDPVTQLETTFNNLGFGGLLQVTNTTDQLYKFLQDPKFYIQGVIKRKRFKVSKIQLNASHSKMVDCHTRLRLTKLLRMESRHLEHTLFLSLQKTSGFCSESKQPEN